MNHRTNEFLNTEIKYQIESFMFNIYGFASNFKSNIKSPIDSLSMNKMIQ